MFGLFAVFLAAQSVAGYLDHNATEAEHGRPQVGYASYLRSGDFVEAVFENWESEFLQMGLYVLLTAWLVQRGSAESEDPDAGRAEEAGGDEGGRTDAPWPVRKGGRGAQALRELPRPRPALAVRLLLRTARRRGRRGLQPGAARARRVSRLDARVPRHLALLVRVVAELAERVPGHRGDGGALDLPQAEGISGVQARRLPAPRDRGLARVLVSRPTTSGSSSRPPWTARRGRVTSHGRVDLPYPLSAARLGSYPPAGRLSPSLTPSRYTW